MSEQEFLDKVKLRLGIIYTDPLKDAELSSMIAEAKGYLTAGGWATSLDSDTAVGAVSIYLKMAQQSDPNALVHNPILISMIVQNRGGAVDGSAGN